MLSLIHFSWELGSEDYLCEDYSFPDQAVADFEQGLVSILTDSTEMPELHTSLDEPDVITSLSSELLHLVIALSHTSKPELAASIRSNKLWFQARALLQPASLATKMSTSKLIHAFS